MGRKITQYPNNVSPTPDNDSLLDLSEKTGASTFDSRKWTLTAFKAWVNSWVVAGSVAWNNITGKPNVVDTTGGTPNYVAKFTDTDTIEESQIFDDGTNVGIGTATPTATFDVLSTAVPGSENLAQFKVSDDISSGLKIINNTSTDGKFIPNISGTGNHALPALRLTANALDDSGTFPVTLFDSRKNNNSEVVTRPLFGWENYGTRKMTMNNLGYLGIGKLPEHMLDVLGTIRVGDVNTFQSTINQANIASISSEFIAGTGPSYVRFRGHSGGASNQLVMSIGGNGKVGINVSTPTATLHLNNTTADNSLLVEDETNPDSTPFVIDNKGNVIIGALTTSQTEKFYLTKSETSPNENFGQSISLAGGGDMKGIRSSVTSGTGNLYGVESNVYSNSASSHMYGIYSNAGKLFVDNPVAVESYGGYFLAGGSFLNVGVYTNVKNNAGASNYCFQGRDGTEDVGKFLKSVTVDGKANWDYVPRVIQLAVSDETTALTTGTNKIKFRMPYQMFVTDIRASLSTAQTSGNIFTVNLTCNGSNVFTTKLTIDNNESTSKTATTPYVSQAPFFPDDAEISVSIDQIGDGTAKGLKLSIIGY